MAINRSRPADSKGDSLTPHPQKLTVGDVKTSPAAPEDPEQPKYQQLDRVEARLREDQVAKLNELTKRVSKARTERSERITNNTLIRIAVDLLVKYEHGLVGNTEDDLRKAVLAAGDQAANAANKSGANRGKRGGKS